MFLNNMATIVLETEDSVKSFVAAHKAYLPYSGYAYIL